MDRYLFRELMGQLLTGVTAITTTTPEGLHGFTANAFCHLSDEPPLALVCVDRLARGRDYLVGSQVFGVSIMAERQEFLAERLAGRAPGLTRRFEGVPYFTASTGAPLLHGCVAWLDCTVEHSYEAGDHTIFIGRAVAVGADEAAQPLLFFRGAYARLEAQV